MEHENPLFNYEGTLNLELVDKMATSLVSHLDAEITAGFDASIGDNRLLRMYVVSYEDDLEAHKNMAFIHLLDEEGGNMCIVRLSGQDATFEVQDYTDTWEIINRCEKLINNCGDPEVRALGRYISSEVLRNSIGHDQQYKHLLDDNEIGQFAAINIVEGLVGKYASSTLKNRAVVLDVEEDRHVHILLREVTTGVLNEAELSQPQLQITLERPRSMLRYFRDFAGLGHLVIANAETEVAQTMELGEDGESIDQQELHNLVVMLLDAIYQVAALEADFDIPDDLSAFSDEV